ncbi:hypothetical protein HFP15_25535 [Amycolatopsis sp. K13G38]|uniref:ESX-1 secretion-associated protein n=1 Tax=Amycolatopsis acididurans TaxID=2724524 RepID=A0ABX1JCY0_9PSEU|nr:hypothetical protein [Amycolatopsis acididurans]NKQ56245.1 hypothetical protein [Amycolatopsis acididurans]
MADAGYEVHPDELNKFGDYLTSTTKPEVEKAASGVRGHNGFDNSAFGIFAAQLLAVPARIAMGVVASNLDGLAKEIADAADRTKKAAKLYTEQDSQAADGLGNFKTELGS